MFETFYHEFEISLKTLSIIFTIALLKIKVNFTVVKLAIVFVACVS